MFGIIGYLWRARTAETVRSEEKASQGASLGVQNVFNDKTSIPVPSKPTSAHFIVGDARYAASGYVQPYKLTHRGPPSLATLIWLKSGQNVSDSFLSKLVPDFNSKDDVFRREFLEGIIFVTDSPKSVEDLISPDALAFLKDCGNKWKEVIQLPSLDAVPAPGVYVAYGQGLFEVYRIYDDVQKVFMTTSIRGPERTHVPLTITAESPGIGQIAVPSRLGTLGCGPDFIQGLRIAVKDNFHIKGFKASLCNKAYYDTYEAPTATAKCISILEDRGARILGTTKLAAFAATEEPIECVDYQAPWNPRGDGYQSPAGSSSGSGAAIASYDWLDVTIGSDTSGSGRRPAHWNGCFAIRPTHGAIDTHGFIPSFPQFDTPTIFTRAIHTCRDFAAAWYGDKLKSRSTDLPVKLIIPKDYLPLIKNKDQLELIYKFVADVERHLGVKSETISLEETWDASPPGQAEGQDFKHYMHKVARNSFFYDDYHNLDKFREDYQKKFSKTPYISPPVRWQWNLSATIKRSERDEAIYRLVVYKKWFSEVIMEVGRKRTMVVIPIENISPRYRDDATTSFDPEGVPMLFLSPILGGPECTVPIGHVPYQSKITGRQEHLPVGLSLLSAPDTDLQLLDMISTCLKQSGRPTEVHVGREMFQGLEG